MITNEWPESSLNRQFEAITEDMKQNGYTFTAIENDYTTGLFEKLRKVYAERRNYINSEQELEQLWKDEINLKEKLSEIAYFTLPGDDKVISFISVV